MVHGRRLNFVYVPIIQFWSAPPVTTLDRKVTLINPLARFRQFRTSRAGAVDPSNRSQSNNSMSSITRNSLAKPGKPDHGWVPSWSVWANRMADVDFLLWVAVILVASLDVLLTYEGIHLGLVELNPIGRLGLTQFGFWSLPAVKVLGLIAGIVGWHVIEDWRWTVPATLFGCWGQATVANGFLLLTVS